MLELDKNIASIGDQDATLSPKSATTKQRFATTPQETEPLATNPYVISFAKYNEKMSQISLLSSNKARKALETLKNIGTNIYSKADFQRNHIDLIPVRREGSYKQLFKGLEDDIELREVKLQQDARIFYFILEPQRTFYVVAITEHHLDTDKVRK